MNSVSRVCVLTVLYSAAQAGILSGSDFFCRDPDTGKLHPANTTWASTTFCGNYTCKLRRKNITAAEYAPFRQINVTKINYFSKLLDKHSESAEITYKKNDNVLREDRNDSSNAEPEYDRYLTDQEIKTISEVLHLMKKSDLDAIIEIYKLAQDIYKEIDTSGIENIVAEVEEYQDKDTVKSIKTDDVNAFNAKAHSYWNNPAFINTRSGDMDTRGTNIITSVAQPNKSGSYFVGPLISTDFRKLPYFYPVSNFQSLSSYMHPQPTANMPRDGNNTPKPKMEKDIQPSIYLPYPFSYIHHYKYNSSKPDTYYDSNFEKYGIFSSNKLSYAKSYLAQVPSAILVNTHVPKNSIANTKPIEKGTKEVLKARFKSNRQELPDWQTSSLNADVLEDVRAHAQEKVKILRPYRKNIKLERVGKLIKLDQISRNKREADVSQESKRAIDLYEVFLDRTMCSSNDTVPGYFRYGNLSQPFPECCPQRIGNR